MIADILLNIVFIFVNAIVSALSLLGTVSEDSAIANGIETITGYLAPVNAVIPIDTIVLIILFDLTFESLYLIYKGIKWGYSKVPGVN
jgi:hypothetical protein